MIQPVFESHVEVLHSLVCPISGNQSDSSVVEHGRDVVKMCEKNRNVEILDRTVPCHGQPLHFRDDDAHVESLLQVQVVLAEQRLNLAQPLTGVGYGEHVSVLAAQLDRGLRDGGTDRRVLVVGDMLKLHGVAATSLGLCHLVYLVYLVYHLSQVTAGQKERWQQ